MRTHKKGWLENKCSTISISCPFILHSRKCKHSIDSVKKHNPSTFLLEGTCSFYWQNKLMYKCPRGFQSLGMFGKSNALNDILCFQRKFKCGSHSNSTIKLPIQPSELIKKHAHKSPIPDARHLHEKMLQTQTIS